MLRRARRNRPGLALGQKRMQDHNREMMARFNLDVTNRNKRACLNVKITFEHRKFTSTLSSLARSPDQTSQGAASLKVLRCS